MQGRIQVFFRRGAPLRIGVTNTSKPHICIFFAAVPVVLESRRSSQGGGGGAHPCSLPPDPPLLPSREQVHNWGTLLFFSGMIEMGSS